MFLSIVIPVYNASRYITKCLDSIWSQNLPVDDYEVICVDDGSRDDSLVVLNEIAKGHPNLRILQNPENLRAGGARNNGVRNARGEYILFIDSDDYFHEGSVLWAFEYQKSHRLDILMMDSSREELGKRSNELVHNFKNLDVMYGREFMLKNSFPFAPWKYVFRKDLMIENNVWFEEKVNCEDVDWTHKLAFYAQKMQYVPKLLTHYILLPYSETGGEYKNITTIKNRLFCASRVLSLKNLYNTRDEFSHLDGVANSTYTVGLKNMCGSYASPSIKYEIIKRYVSADINLINSNHVLKFAYKHPCLFAHLSTISAPFFRGALYIKRKLLGRK